MQRVKLHQLKHLRVPLEFPNSILQVVILVLQFSQQFFDLSLLCL
jgi:hypothetical protein